MSQKGTVRHHRRSTEDAETPLYDPLCVWTEPVQVNYNKAKAKTHELTPFTHQTALGGSVRLQNAGFML